MGTYLAVKPVTGSLISLLHPPVVGGWWLAVVKNRRNGLGRCQGYVCVYVYVNEDKDGQWGLDIVRRRNTNFSYFSLSPLLFSIE